MTGAYLFKVVDGSKVPTEVEYLTTEERYEIFKDRDVEEVINWLDLVCDTLVKNILMLDQERDFLAEQEKELE